MAETAGALLHPDTPTKSDLLELTFEQTRDWLAARGYPAFRAKQLANWIYSSLGDDFAAMHTLPAALREQLARDATIAGPHVRTELVAKDGRTRKLLLTLADGRLIETVLMLYPAAGESRARATVCVSTQAGCAYGCTFCATGQMGFDRHLTAGEIVAQVLFFARELRDAPWSVKGDREGRPYYTQDESKRAEYGRSGPRGRADSRVTIDHITNIVLMGMGEPLHNYDNVMQALRILNNPNGFNLGARHMTVSTVGLVPAIRKLSQ